jgi:hypothetical protein
LKKIFAIAMLVVLVFNTGGYVLLFEYLIKRSDDFANEQIAKGLYKPDELVEIKIPVNLPDIEEQSDFQGISGQVKLSDNDYNYVAIKMTRDTMFLMCIPNYEKTRLVSENIITAKNISDSPLGKKNHLPVVKKSGIDDNYYFPLTLFKLAVNTTPLHKPGTDLKQIIPTAYLTTPAQPPELQGILA